MRLFAREGYVSAQVLATKEDFRDSQHYDNMKSCMENLLRDNVIPIVNENDVVAVAELLFTDNDELVGLIASQIHADALLILTSVDGVIAGNVGDPSATVIAEVDFLMRALSKISKTYHARKERIWTGRHADEIRYSEKLSREGITTHIVNGKKGGCARRSLWR